MQNRSDFENEHGETQNHDGTAPDLELESTESRDFALQKIRSARSVSIPPEMFEKPFLSPPTTVKGDLRKTFGNPTPLGLGGFLMALTPLTCDLLGWRRSSLTAAKDGSYDMGAYFFFRGLLMTVASVMEWLLGNTPMHLS